MRGVAANILWTKANEYKKKEDWSNMMATVDTIVRLQPHFISVWRFQAWNVAFNVSVEWDDYRDRYYWVVRGVKFLQGGTLVNKTEPTLPWDVGWIISQKMGKSDEREHFRKLFVQDDEFHGNRPMAERDSWLVGKVYYREAQQVLAQRKETQRGEDIKGINPVTFHAEAPLNQIYYASALVAEGTFDQKARLAWVRGLREWAGTQPEDNSYGQTLLKSPAGLIRLNDYDKYMNEANEMLEKLEALAPAGLVESLLAPKRANLTKQQLAALDIPPQKRTASQQLFALAAQEIIALTPKELVDAFPADKKAEATKLAIEAERLQNLGYWVSQRRDIVNFVYWRTRCEAEQTRNALSAHRFLFNAGVAAPQARFEEAQDDFEEGFEHWRLVLEQFPLLLRDQITAEDMIEHIRKYQKTLGHLDEKFPIRGYGLAANTEITDWPAFCKLLATGAEPGKEQTPAGRVWAYWGRPENSVWGDPAQKAVLSSLLAPKIDTETQNEILFAFNSTLKWPKLYDSASFSEVKLRSGLSDQLSADLLILPRRETRIRNRHLLEDSFGPLLARVPHYFVLTNLFESHKHNALERGVTVPADMELPNEPQYPKSPGPEETPPK